MQLDSLCLSVKDTQTLNGYLKSMPQSLLLVAESGFGKTNIARALALELVGQKEYLCKFIEPDADKQSITIEQARSVKSFFALKTNDPSSKRVVVLDRADTMTIEAQNSLLKILEEPPVNCYLILTASRPNILLSTIRSRVTSHQLVAPKLEDLEPYLIQNGHSSLDIRKATNLSGGLPGLTVSILNKENTEITESVSLAKQILSESTFERLKRVDILAKNKIATVGILEALKIICNATITNTISHGKDTSKWAQILRESNSALSMLDKNASTKLVLTNLFLNI